METLNTNFLKYVAQDLLATGKNFERSMLVFPSMRSLSYFQMHLLAKMPDAGILPECTTIAALFDRLSKKKTADALMQQIIMRQCLKACLPAYGEEFIEHVTPKMLSDLNELELFEVPVEKAFKHAADFYKIDTWGKEKDEALFHEQFMNLCLKATEIKRNFDEKLLNKSLNTSAQRIETASNNLESLSDFESIAFVGFANLTKKEIAFIEACKQKMALSFYWKTHEWYVKDERNEAGRFYRTLPEDFKKSAIGFMPFTNPEISYASFSSNPESILFLVQKLRNDLQTAGKDVQFAIVLGDETVLPMLLHFLSAESGLVNVSVSIPAEFSVLIKDVLSKSRPWFKQVLSEEERFKKVYSFVKTWEPKSFSEPMNRVFLEQRDKLLRDLALIRSDADLFAEYFSNWLRFQSRLRNLSLNVKGEKASRVQIFGLLESRNLDFDYLYFLNFNEGNFQGKIQYNSVLPFQLRAQFGLPLTEEKESVFSYYFFSLISSASAVYVSYLNAGSGFNSDEQSRLLQQIIYENQFTRLNALSTEVRIASAFEDIIVRDNAFDQEFQAFLERGVSPSAINLYLRNPFEFYYRYLWRIDEVRTMDPQEDAALLGNVVHECLEILFTEFIGEFIDETNLQTLKSRWKTNYRSIILQTKDGANSDLAAYMHSHISNTIEKYLDQEIRRVKQEGAFQLIALEQEYKKTLALDGRPFILKGKIDRIEKSGSTLRLIDFKTGKISAKDLQVKQNDLFEDLWQDDKKEKIRQLLIYFALVEGTKFMHGIDKVDLCIDSLFSANPERYSFVNESENEVLSLELIEGSVVKVLDDMQKRQKNFTECYK